MERDGNADTRAPGRAAPLLSSSRLMARSTSRIVPQWLLVTLRRLGNRCNPIFRQSVLDPWRRDGQSLAARVADHASGAGLFQTSRSHDVANDAAQHAACEHVRRKM